MPRTKSTQPRPPRYILEPGALVYDSLSQAAGLAPISPEARDTYRVILGFSWMNKYQFTAPITRRHIADERGIADEGTITRHVAELVQAGYLTIQPGNGSANTYIPHITYQTDTNTATALKAVLETAHSPAEESADPQITVYSPQPQPQPTVYSPQPTASSATTDEPLARAPGVSGEPLAYKPGVPINSSSSSLTLNPDLNSQQLLLLNILLDFGVFPDSVCDMLVSPGYSDVLAWLHALIEDEGVRNVASVLVANVLRDHRPAPRGPRPGSSGERERIQREIDWGLRPRPAPARAAQSVPPAPPPADAPPMSVEMQQATQTWRRALEKLQLQLTGATYDTWLRRTRLVSADGGVYIIGVHNGYAKDWLENRLYSMIKRTLVSIINWPVEVRFVVLDMEAA